MRRREFITLVVGAAVAWPFAARGQQLPVIAFLSSGPPAAFAHLIIAFRQGLKDTSYVEGENVEFEYSWADDQYDRFPALAAELVRRRVSLIVANGGTAAAIAAKTATARIPIVFYVGGDPVAQGLVASLNRPGANITGLGWLGLALGAKRLELIRDLQPNVTDIAMLVNPNNPDTEFEMLDVQQAARVLGLQLQLLYASGDTGFDGPFTKLPWHGSRALLVGSDVFFSSQRSRLVALAARHAIPAIYERRDFPDAGGLISYGHHRADAYRQLGFYSGRILKGEKPSDLPVQQPTKFELVINLKTAKALGIEVPPMLLARADEVIE